MTRGLIAAYSAAQREAADVYHLHDPELLPLAFLLKREAKVVFDAHEDLPAQLLTKEWIPPRLRGPLAQIFGKMMPVLMRPADAVVAATPAIARTIEVRPVTLVQNHPRSLEHVVGLPFAEREASVAYIGGLSEIRGARQLVDSLALLPPESPVQLRCAALLEGPHLRERLCAREGWARVRWEGWRTKDQLGQLLSECRAGIVTFLPAPNHVAAQPNKLFEYMAAGLPVIASHFPLWREIVEGNRCGVVVDPRDPRAIAEAIERVVANPSEAEEMGRRGRRAIEYTYNWESQQINLLKLYEGFACASGS